MKKWRLIAIVLGLLLMASLWLNLAGSSFSTGSNLQTFIVRPRTESVPALNIQVEPLSAYDEAMPQDCANGQAAGRRVSPKCAVVPPPSIGIGR